MRRIIRIVLFTFVALSLAPALQAQTASATSGTSETATQTYVKLIYIEKIFPTVEGYKVVYITAAGHLETTYIPRAWFSGSTGGKGEIVYGYGHEYPFMQIAYRAGKFSYVRLFLAKSFNDPSWGYIPASAEELKGKFSIDSLDLKY